jgi:hypothetical protein
VTHSLGYIRTETVEGGSCVIRACPSCTPSSWKSMVGV